MRTPAIRPPRPKPVKAEQFVLIWEPWKHGISTAYIAMTRESDGEFIARRIVSPSLRVYRRGVGAIEVIKTREIIARPYDSLGDLLHNSPLDREQRAFFRSRLRPCDLRMSKSLERRLIHDLAVEELSEL
jgi:hypothetical protein